MKKLYCALAAAAIALSANAADYYLIGGFNGWAAKDPTCKFTEKDATTYELDYNGTLTSGFKINDGTWTNNDANFGSAGNNDPLTLGQEFSLTVGGDSKDIVMSENIENPHIVLNVADASAPTLTITGQGVEATYIYGLWGNFDGGEDWSAVNLTEKEGKWVSEKTTVAACSFGIKQMDASTGSQTGWLASADAAEVTVGTAMPLMVNGTNFTLEAGTYTFTLDIDAMTMLVSGEGDTPNPPVPPVTEEKDLYLVGDFNGWTNGQENYKFSREENVYTLTLEDGLTGEWKVTDGTWDYNFGAGEENKLSSGVEADAWFFSGNNFDGAFSGKTTIVFTLVEGSDVNGSSIPSKIVVTSEAVAEPDPIENWYVSVQGPFNEWLGEGVNPNAEGVAIISGLAIDAEGFKVKVWNGLKDARYCNGEEIALDTPVVVEGNSDTLMTIADSTEGALYVVEFNVTTNEMKVSLDPKSGVESINVAVDAAVYFNLQGMKVENPENGIFVKVSNGKAVKVVF